MPYKETDGVFLAPMTLKRSGINRRKNEDIKKIQKYYSYNSNIAYAILTCIGEISNNFQEHAVLDTQSIIVAKGNRNHFEIACADTGDGIISTLGPSLKEKVL